MEMTETYTSDDVAKYFNRTRAEWEQAINAAAPDEAFVLVADMTLDSGLKEWERNSLTQFAAKRMGTSFRALNKDLKALNDESESDEPKKNHLDYARETLASFGEGNTLFDKGVFWVWRNKGVWEPVLDHEIRKAAATCLEGQEAITDSLIRSVVAIARDESYSSRAKFDQPADRRINLTNGTLEYFDGVWTLREHRREDYLTTQLPVTYDPGAICPRFDRFLEEIFEGDGDAKEKALCLVEMMGYTLLQSCQFEKFIILVGSGSNGKSVFLNVLRNLVGADQTAAVEPAKLNNPVDRAHLHNKLANIAPELPVGGMLHDALMKAFTSGDAVNAALKYGQPFDYTPFATFWMGTNHMPHTRDLSHGMFRRALILKFNRQFSDSNKEIGLADKLLQELPGILVKAIRALAGVIERGGFTVPASSEEALKAWRTDADQVAQFFQGVCEIDGNTQGTSHNLLFKMFLHWAKNENIKHAVTGKSFTQRMEELGHKSEKITIDGEWVRGFKGICFQSHVRIPLELLMP